MAKTGRDPLRAPVFIKSEEEPQVDQRLSLKVTTAAGFPEPLGTQVAVDPSGSPFGASRKAPLSVLPARLPALVFRRDSPLNSNRCALCTSRSRIASARAGTSPRRARTSPFRYEPHPQPIRPRSSSPQKSHWAETCFKGRGSIRNSTARRPEWCWSVGAPGGNCLRDLLPCFLGSGPRRTMFGGWAGGTVTSLEAAFQDRRCKIRARATKLRAGGPASTHPGTSRRNSRSPRHHGSVPALRTGRTLARPLRKRWRFGTLCGSARRRCSSGVGRERTGPARCQRSPGACRLSPEGFHEVARDFNPGRASARSSHLIGPRHKAERAQAAR